MGLLQGFERNNYHIYMDNYYTSIPLFQEMVAKRFEACGTTRTDRVGMPEEWKKKGKTYQKLKKGEVRTKKIDGIMALQWQDKRTITMLTTMHDNKMVTKRRRSRFGNNNEENVMKPLCINEYNKHLGGVDRSDQLLSYHGFTHKTLKWSNRAAFHLLDLATVNSYILYKLSNGKKAHAQYRIDIANALLLEAGHNTEENNDDAQVTTNCLTGRHFPSKLPLHSSGSKCQRQCVVCSNKRGRTTSTYCCTKCNVTLCITPCFELYHTHKDPQRYLD